MRRLSLSMRLVLIVAGAVFLLQIVAFAVQVTRDDGFTLGGIRPSFARQVASLTRLFDRLPPVRQQLALDLLNNARFDVAIANQPPQADPGGVLLGWSARITAERIAAEGVGFDRIEVSNIRAARPEGGPLARLVGRHLRITIALQNGQYLVINPASEVDSYVYGGILAALAGLVGLLILGAAVVFVLRETRPLTALTENMEQFARTAVPRELDERGASDLRSLIGATNRMQHQIAALIRNRALILAGMSHDLRTQVTKLRLRLELMAPSPGRDQAIADIEAMQALVEQALEFAASTNNGEGGRTDVAALLDGMLADHPQMSWAGHGPVRLAIGEAALRRVIDNLVGNAIAYGQRADVTVSATESEASIAIADRGPGVPMGERELIFEPFYRLEGSRSREHGGTGLGLAIARQIVDRHGGRIGVTDRPGGGAVFTVTLPLAA
ncbi:ATP-binding protein [Devosia sp. CN2-171]|uniref:ATP-binding protein n=1 Tax=Devosia sp. CN2-171 TaxID=3400909 RepID=UPI003BF8B6BD